MTTAFFGIDQPAEFDAVGDVLLHLLLQRTQPVVRRAKSNHKLRSEDREAPTPVALPGFPPAPFVELCRVGRAARTVAEIEPGARTGYHPSPLLLGPNGERTSAPNAPFSGSIGGVTMTVPSAVLEERVRETFRIARGILLQTIQAR